MTHQSTSAESLNEQMQTLRDIVDSVDHPCQSSEPDAPRTQQPSGAHHPGGAAAAVHHGCPG
eukprot:8627713-Pyramimonas_sp.AAC.1